MYHPNSLHTGLLSSWLSFESCIHGCLILQKGTAFVWEYSAKTVSLGGAVYFAWFNSTFLRIFQGSLLFLFTLFYHNLLASHIISRLSSLFTLFLWNVTIVMNILVTASRRYWSCFQYSKTWTIFFMQLKAKFSITPPCNLLSISLITFLIA